MRASGRWVVRFAGDFAAISALRATALRRLRSETRLWAQCGRWNSLQEGFYLQWNKTNFFSLHFVES